MRKTLSEFISKTLTIRYKLPTSKISKTSLTVKNDYCLDTTNQNDVAESIYYSIVDYCLNESEIDITKLNEHQIYAIENRLRYANEDELDTQLKYGFFGEVFLNILLEHFLATKKIIAKGYFYSPIEKSEPKGYDSFHFFENDQNCFEFWFGESKMYISLTTAAISVFKNINRALSSKYYETNLRAILTRIRDIDRSKIAPLFGEIESRLKNERVILKDLIKTYDIKVIYPVMFAYNEKSLDYDEKIINSVSIIEDIISKSSVLNEITAEVLFIFVPLDDVISIKKDVLQWIIEKKSMI